MHLIIDFLLLLQYRFKTVWIGIKFLNTNGTLLYSNSISAVTNIIPYLSLNIYMLCYSSTRQAHCQHEQHDMSMQCPYSAWSQICLWCPANSSVYCHAPLAQTDLGPGYFLSCTFFTHHTVKNVKSFQCYLQDKSFSLGDTHRSNRKADDLSRSCCV